MPKPFYPLSFRWFIFTEMLFGNCLLSVIYQRSYYHYNLISIWYFWHTLLHNHRQKETTWKRFFHYIYYIYFPLYILYILFHYIFKFYVLCKINRHYRKWNSLCFLITIYSRYLFLTVFRVYIKTYTIGP